jgi:hypothetical protein
MKPMSVPKCGAESIASSASLAEVGTAAPQGIIMARSVSSIVKFDSSGIHSVDKALPKHLMTLAMEKVT